MKYYLTLLAAALMLVACNKENGGGETPAPAPDPAPDPETYTTTVSFENIEDLDIEKTTWVITGEPTLEAWLAMIQKMRELEAKGESTYGTISVVMPDVEVAPGMMQAFITDNGLVSVASHYNNVLVSFSGPKMKRIPSHMFENCLKLETVDLPVAMSSWSQTTTPGVFAQYAGLSRTFYGTENLKEIDLPNAIALSAEFALNSRAEVIRLPKVDRVAGYDLFGGNDCLKELYLTTTSTTDFYCDQRAFQKIGGPLTIYYAKEQTYTAIHDAVGDSQNGHTITYVNINAE